MRSIPLLIAAGLLASCAAAPPAPVRTAEGMRQLDDLLAGKVPLAPANCVPPLRMSDMRVIDENTIAFRDGRSRAYVAHTTGCSNLRPNGSYALVTTQTGGFGLCRGDSAQVRDLAAGLIVGACAITDVTVFGVPGR